MCKGGTHLSVSIHTAQQLIREDGPLEAGGSEDLTEEPACKGGMGNELLMQLFQRGRATKKVLSYRCLQYGHPTWQKVERTKSSLPIVWHREVTR